MHPQSPAKAKQRGAVMLVMLVIVVMGITAALVNSLSATALKNARQEITAAALAQAKDAIIGKAVASNDYPGGLYCPDTDDDGESDAGGGSECPQYIGRLPWKTLGLPDLRDGAGERLWYTLSRNVRRYASVRPLNSDTTGTLNITGDYTASNLVAIVFAPGMVVGNKSRSASQTAFCTTTGNTQRENRCAVNYLEGSNANSSPGAAPNTNYQYELQSDSFNDQLIGISYQHLLPLVEKRIAREAKKCLDDYAVTYNNKYPWPETVSTVLFRNAGHQGNLFGRLQIVPNTQNATLAITTMQSRFDALWPALATFAANKTWSNWNAMKNKADAAKDAAADVKNYYDGSPQNIPAIENAADDLKDAADDARDDLTTSSSAAAIAAVQQDIVNAANAFISTMPLLPQASGMVNTTWPASCTLLSSAYWNDWKDLVFYQVASGYRPKDSSASCGSSCLSVEGSGHSLAGSGSYRATVIVAGKKLTANRTPSNIGDYLGADNLLPSGDYTKPYMTHRITDAAYQSVNDLVLCLDGYPLNVNAYCK